MAAPANQPLLGEEPGFRERAGSAAQTGAKKVCSTCGLVAIVVFILACIGQGVLYSVFTFGCGPKAIGSEYSYPGGGTSKAGGPEFNLMPGDSLLSERESMFWGWPMDVLPANVAGTAAGAQVGTWWRNKGLLFYTYTYEDIANSKMTLYMRANFWTPWMSYKIARCDGKGPVVTFSEQGHWINNKIRGVFRMNQAQSYSIWLDGVLAADAQEVSTGYPSLTITNVKTGKEIASSILNNRNFHGDKDQWYVHNTEEAQLPFFISSAISLPFAYGESFSKNAAAAEKQARAAGKKLGRPDQDGTHQNFLTLLATGAKDKDTEIKAVVETKADSSPAAAKAAEPVAKAEAKPAPAKVAEPAAKAAPAPPAPTPAPAPLTPLQSAQKAYDDALKKANSNIADFETRVAHLKAVSQDPAQVEALAKKMLSETGPDVHMLHEAEAARKKHAKELRSSGKSAAKALKHAARMLEHARKKAGERERVYEGDFQKQEEYAEKMEDHAENLGDSAQNHIESIYRNIKGQFERARDEAEAAAKAAAKEAVEKAAAAQDAAEKAAAAKVSTAQEQFEHARAQAAEKAAAAEVAAKAAAKAATEKAAALKKEAVDKAAAGTAGANAAAKEAAEKAEAAEKEAADKAAAGEVAAKAAAKAAAAKAEAAEKAAAKEAADKAAAAKAAFVEEVEGKPAAAKPKPAAAKPAAKPAPEPAAPKEEKKPAAKEPVQHV